MPIERLDLRPQLAGSEFVFGVFRVGGYPFAKLRPEGFSLLISRLFGEEDCKVADRVQPSFPVAPSVSWKCDGASVEAFAFLILMYQMQSKRQIAHR